MRDAAEVIVIVGGVDDDDAVPAGQRFDSFFQRSAACGLLLRCRIVELLEAEMVGDAEVAAALPCPRAPVFDMPGETSLPCVEIDGGNALTGIDQRHGGMHGDGRLARTALHIADNDHASRQRPRQTFSRHRMTLLHHRWMRQQLRLIRRFPASGDAADF
jgi:hypothetical protein